MLTGNSLNSISQAAADDFPTVRGGLRAGVSQLPGFDFWAVDNSQISALFPYHGLHRNNPATSGQGHLASRFRNPLRGSSGAGSRQPRRDPPKPYLAIVRYKDPRD